MVSAAQALLDAPINTGVYPFGILRLEPHTKLQLVDQTNGYYKGTGLRTATAAFANAKADLDRAIKHHEPIDGRVAATFLARYAWFRADYAAVNRFPNAQYPMRRFRALIRQALAFDPKNSQALLMWYFYQYCAHSRQWVVQIPEKPPHIPETLIKFSFPTKWKNRIRGELKSFLKAHPNNFAAWVFFGNLSGIERKPVIEMMRCAKYGDPFYFSSRPCSIPGYVTWGKKFLRNYAKAYAIYYGHPPPKKPKK